MKTKTCAVCAFILWCCAAAVWAEVVLTTRDGAGADAEVGNDSQVGPDTNAGASGRMRIRQLANTRSKISFVRFDISAVSGDLSGAILTLETTWQKGSNKAVSVYGLTDESLDFWNEMAITYNTAPALLPATDGNYALDTGKAVLLGTFMTPPVPDPAIYPVRFSSNPADLDMTAFLNADTNGLVTLILVGANDETELATKEHGIYLAPTLTLPNAERDEEPEDPEDPEDPEEQASTLGPRQMERLDRGVVAVRTGSGQVFVSWRLLGTEWGKDVGFHLYRGSTRLTASPITGATNYSDMTSVNSTYSVSAVIDGVEWPASEPVSVWTTPYLEIPLLRPAGGTTPDGVDYTYSPNDLSVGDLTGDGKYEIIVKWDPSNSKDNAHSGHTGNVYLDAYTLAGTFMWRIDLGVNIRAGAHYTQFMVYDLDGDGRAEIACKTAPGTIDGLGNFVLLPGDDPYADYRNSSGYIVTGPEYLTVFDGLTGAELATTEFYPDRVNVSQWGDTYGNRADRFLAGVAYIDGERPSLIMARGYYGPQSGRSARNEIVAYNWRQGKLTQEWYFKAGQGINNNINVEYIGQGCHSLAIADVTGNGRDDIIYGSATIKHDGTGLYSTRLGHGDALHVSDMDPSRPGLEVFMPHESPGSNGGVGASFRCAATGEVLWYTTATSDVGRGVAFDIDPRYPGYEAWATNSNAVYSAKGELIASSRPSVNFGVWWTGDLLRELLDGTSIDKWNWTASNTTRLLSAATFGAASNNGTKANPGLAADILGDWREEVIWRHSDNTRLLVFTTTIPTEHRLYTLMHDPVYRMSAAWQNTAYNQPTHPGFFLGADMAPPPTPKIRYAGDTSEGILWEWWLGVSGSAVSDLTGHANYPHAPSGSEVLYRFETPQDWDNSYGSRLRGYLIAPETGDYTFWIAGDDTAELRFSPDARPEQARLIAHVPAWTDYRQWDTYAAQKSEPVSLVAGRKYYIEALHKEGTGGDHLSVAWQGPEMERQVIGGQYLKPWLGLLFGDLNDSGAVDNSDLTAFADAWLMSGCDLSLRYDLTGDCLIDYADFAVIARYWMALPVQEP